MPAQSPFQEHLYTNYIPTDDEMDQIRADLPQHEAELVSLNKLIRELTARHNGIKAHIDSHRALISYARRLPQDIIEEIFLACLPTEGCPKLNSREAPLILGHICGLWRSIAFGMPSLWSSLHFSMQAPWRDFAKHSEAITDWLVRSGELPLAISTWGETMYREHYHQIITRFSHRIRSLHMSDMTVTQYLLVAGLDAPLLDEIRFAPRYWDHGLGQRVLLSKLFRGENLRRVTLYSLEDMWSFVPIAPFFWHHLTDLSLEAGDNGGLYCRSAHRLIKGCPNLRSLKFAFQTDWSEDQPFHPTKHITLPNLESLTILLSYTDINHVYKDLVDMLFMPRLTVFHLSHSRTIPRTSPCPPLSNLECLDHLAARSPEIVNLTLDFLYLTKTTGVHLLQLFPRVETLQLMADEMYTLGNRTMGQSQRDAIEFIKLLNRLCPDLTELVLESESSITEFSEAIIGFLNSTTTLRRFDIRCSCVLDSEARETVPDFQLFRRRGIVINTTYTYPPLKATSGQFSAFGMAF
ncbi:hypothetical protein FB45DRAFT_1018142 [Roridomyces roridus]|uniref:F-box domain-containing protein n=1 Tax=Roridomyces roridus TaxID=1738132 RepID=A0AAD7G2S9_9AGAR|nr:hypothetical protein FB45DRAFT_1018142 [Roridomyces roridus]